MKGWILKLKLRAKLLLAFSAVLFLSVLMMLFAWRTIYTINSYQTLSATIDDVQIDILKLDLASKDFLADGYKQTDFQEKSKSKSVDSFRAHWSGAWKKLQMIQTQHSFQSNETLLKVLRTLPRLDSQFVKIISLYQTRGFKDFGLEGQLRKAIHSVENSSFPYDKADMLMLRRHEKDFFLRRDLKYQAEFNKKEESFASWIQNQQASEERSKIAQELSEYRRLFNQVVEIDQAIGLQEDDGIKKGIHDDLAVIHQCMETLNAFVQTKSKSEKDKAIFTFFILFLVQLVGGVALASFASRRITRSAIELRDAMKKFAEGIFPDKLVPYGSDETEETKIAFNHLLERIRAALEFSQRLGDGNLQAQYPDTYREDILAQSLIKMQAALTEATEKQRIINWTNYGAAQLNEVLKDNHDRIQTLGDNILKMIVQYVGMNQGALYLAEQTEGNWHAERISSYAYGKKRFVNERVEAGQGIVGQCLMEKELILLTEVPPNYIRITSGLGEAVPQFVMILPLVFRDELVGILELASLSKIPDYQIDFLKKIAENIGSILFNKKLNSETTRLLAEAREQAQQLSVQEEEIRQNAEEMQAIQEQLTREVKILEAENSGLKMMVK